MKIYYKSYIFGFIKIINVNSEYKVLFRSLTPGSNNTKV